MLLFFFSIVAVSDDKSKKDKECEVYGAYEGADGIWYNCEILGSDIELDKEYLKKLNIGSYEDEDEYSEEQQGQGCDPEEEYSEERSYDESEEQAGCQEESVYQDGIQDGEYSEEASFREGVEVDRD